jgi:hypothetical protein
MVPAPQAEWCETMRAASSESAAQRENHDHASKTKTYFYSLTFSLMKK